MEALTEKAKETGLTTVYTAQESAQAMYYMAMAGWDAQEMLDGMSGMVNLAAAAGEDLAEVSDIVTDNLTAFGLKASDTAHFADVLAKTAANSNTNISIMGDTFKSSSALAGALGYSIEDVSVAVGLMANRATKGTRAGTALRNIFNGFVEGMTLTGQSFGEVEVSAVNADGSVKSFMETVRVLREYFSQMTGAEKIENAYGIAGMRGYNGLLAIVNATDEDFQKLYDDISDCSGAAQEMADIKLDNMKGDLTLMQSAWEGLKITIGEQFEPEMRSLYSLGTDVFDLASDFVEANPTLVKTVAGTAAALMGVTTALTAIAAAKKAVAALELGTLFGVGAGPILAVAAAIGVAVSAVTALTTEATEGIPKLADLTEETLSLRQAMEDAGDTYDDTTAQTLATVAAAENYLDKLDQLDQGSTEYNNTLALLEETMPELGEYITETTDKFGRTTYVLNTTTDALRENIQAWKENAMAQALQEEYQSVYQNYAAAMVEQQKKSIELTRAKQAETDAEAKYNAIWQERAALIDEAEKKAQAWNKENPTLTQTYEAFLDREKYDELTDALEDQDHEWDKASDTVATYEAALAECDETVEQGAEEVGLLDAAYKEMVGDAQDGADANRDLNVSVEDVVASVEELAAAYSEAYEDARESIRKQESLWDELPEVAAKSVGEITNTLNEHTQYWSNYNANLETILSHSGEIDGLAAVVADLAGDYSEESVNVAAGIADALERGDTAKVTEMINAWLRYQAVMDEAARTNTMITQDIAGDMEDMSAAISSAIENAEDTDGAYDAALQVAMAYIDGFADQSPTISAAFQQVALDAINAALGTAYRSLENASIATSQLKTPGMDGYAGGTTNATAGIHLVGEHGPELVSFRGGERVLTAARTQAALESYGGNSYTVSVNVEGNATEDTAREIARQVRDALEEIDEDRRRRAYV
jgi:TP901 family phage tail tape measure protein